MSSLAMKGAKTYSGDPEAAAWFQDQYRMAVVRASRYFVLAMVFGVIAAAAVGAVWYLLPLRTLKPVVVTVDSRMGLVTSVQQYDDGAQLTQNEAIVQSYLYRYAIARLTYDPTVDLNRNYDIVRVMTAPQAGNEFENEISNNNPAQPRKYLQNFNHSQCACLVSIAIGQRHRASTTFDDAKTQRNRNRA